MLFPEEFQKGQNAAAAYRAEDGTIFLIKQSNIELNSGEELR